jgi:hypothetical protein
VCVVGTLHGNARAQTSDPLRVERAAGTEDCPDAIALSERISAIRGRDDTPNDSSYQVSFTHTGDTFSSVIRSGPNGESQRVLQGHGSTCAALAQATAVTLALLFDSQPDRKPPPPPEPPKPAPAPQVESSLVAPVAADPQASRVRVDSTFSVGAVGLAFVLRPLSPAFTGEVGLQVKRWRAGLGVLWNPAQSLPLEPSEGHVSESLLSGTARSCLALVGAQSLHLDVCTGLFVGIVKAQAVGFTVNQPERHRAWLAIPLELSLADTSGPVGWELSAAALGSLVHHDFEVTHLGTAYDAPRVGALLTLRAVGLWSW